MNENAIILKQPERDILDQAYREWVAKHGEPVLYVPTVSAGQVHRNGHLPGRGLGRVTVRRMV